MAANTASNVIENCRSASEPEMISSIVRRLYTTSFGSRLSLHAEPDRRGEWVDRGTNHDRCAAHPQREHAVLELLGRVADGDDPYRKISRTARPP